MQDLNTSIPSARPVPHKYLLEPQELFHCGAQRRWPHDIFLGGRGQRWAVLSYCFGRGTPTISFHRDKFTAKKVKRDLDREGCSHTDGLRCYVARELGAAKDYHVIVDLGPMCLEHVARGWWE